MTKALVSKPQPSPKNQVLQKSYGSVPEVMDVPNLIQLQTASYEWLKTDGLAALFTEVSPIQDFIGGRFAFPEGASVHASIHPKDSMVRDLLMDSSRRACGGQ